jgi:hypothetical protein
VTPSPVRAAAAALVCAAALALAGGAPAQRSPDARGPRLLVADGGRLLAGTPQEKLAPLARHGFEAWASFSPDGTRILASATGGGRLRLVTLNADGTGIRPLSTGGAGDEVDGRWSRDGARIAFTRREADGTTDVELVPGRGGEATRAVANARQPAWAPNGRWLAYVSDAAGSADVYLHSLESGNDSPLTSEPGAETQPVFSPDGSRVVFVSDASGSRDLVLVTLATGVQEPLTADPGDETAPVWSPDTREVGFVSTAADGTRALKAVRVADGAQRVLASVGPQTSGFDWRVVPLGRELLPDMVQLLPANLVITAAGGGRFRLGFDSSVANVGRGALEVRAVRRGGAPTMHASQLVTLDGGGARAYRDVGFMRYFTSAEHNHWHFLGYERYELRRSDGALLVRDHKAGFCFRDNTARRVRRHLPGEPAGAVYVDNCRKNQPRALAVTTGSSIGSIDWYPAFFHGQYVDITGIPAGRYDLVHRVNADFALRELRYGNDAATLAIRIAWPRGRSAAPSVAVLRRCPDRDRC